MGALMHQHLRLKFNRHRNAGNNISGTCGRTATKTYILPEFADHMDLPKKSFTPWAITRSLPNHERHGVGNVVNRGVEKVAVSGRVNGVYQFRVEAVTSCYRDIRARRLFAANLGMVGALPETVCLDKLKFN